LLVEYKENKTIMEAEEAEAVKLHLFSSTHCFEWLKWNNYADVDLIGVADGITKVQEEISNYPPEHEHILTLTVFL
jgi:cupin superfamily acireductone dioxygenase involved in methionine salvage